MPERTLTGQRAEDPAQVLAQVLSMKREVLLRAYHGWLPREELEECLGQAALELVQRARREGGGFASPGHAKNALEQRLRSRIYDRLRSRAGRSPIEAALARAASLDDAQLLPDARMDTERAALEGLGLSYVVQLTCALSADQRLALLNHVFIGMSTREFCARFGWSEARYRKVLQRARRRLRAALEDAS